jgi:predicted phosphoribosyltransferase
VACICILHDAVIHAVGLPSAVVDQVTHDEECELLRREEVYRGSRPALPVEGHVIILVDDGLATGSTMRAAIAAIRQRRPASIVAVPVAAPETCEELRQEADEIYCDMTPAVFFGVGQWYEDFSQTTDKEVRSLLEQAPSLAKA